MAASVRVSSPTLVGRREELASIRSVVADIGEGRPQVIVIGGESGAGKTRLVDEATAGLGPGVRVLRGHCLVYGAGLPYLPFAEIIRELVHELEPGKLKTLLGPAGAELAQLVPEIGEVASPSAASLRGGSELQRLRLFEALLRVVERVADDRPTVFVFEDLQWIDPASLQLLAFLSQSMRQGNIVLIVTVRTEALADPGPVLPFLVELERVSGVLRIELERLDREATRRQITAILGESVDHAVSERIWEQGEGNPLFTEELVAATMAGTDLASPRLRDLLGARVARLPADSLRVLRVAAVLGRTVDIELLRAAAALEPEAIDRAIEVGLDEQVLVRGGESDAGCRFRHELVRSVIAERLPAPEARRVHAAYAAALELRQDADPSAVAYHWDAAGDAQRSLRWHVRAGFSAESRYAYLAALRHYERVLELWAQTPGGEEVTGTTRPRVLQRASTTAARGGQYDRAIELSRQLLEDPPDDEELTELARSSLRWYLWESGRPDTALAEARQAVASQSPETADRWRANATAHLAGLLLVNDDIGAARVNAEEALRLAQAAHAVDEEVLANGVIGGCLLLEGDVDAGIARIAETVEAARRIEQADSAQPADRLDDRRYPVGVVLASTQLAAAYEVADRPEEVVNVAEAAYARAVEQGVARSYGATLRAASARGMYRSGRWDDALEIIEEALRLGASGSGRVGLLAMSALINAARALDDEADEALRLAEDERVATTAPEVIHWLGVARAERLVWAGRPLEVAAIVADAYGEATEVARGASLSQAMGLDASLPQLLTYAARAGADLALVERSEGGPAALSRLALERVQTALERVRRRPGLSASWAPELALARAELARAEHGPGRRAVTRWQRAAAATAGRPYAEAYARWRLASALLGDQRRTDEAASEIEQALRLAEGLGAARLREAIVELGNRAGIGREGSDRSRARPFGLTERELEVLALLAAGLGNREIADRLFISPKTASVHVSNIYGKLGVESRVAAATVAHELGLVGASDAAEVPNRE